jgi:hypothetical protein
MKRALVMCFQRNRQVCGRGGLDSDVFDSAMKKKAIWLSPFSGQSQEADTRIRFQLGI